MQFICLNFSSFSSNFRFFVVVFGACWKMDIHIHINSIVVFVLICQKYILVVIIDVFCDKRFRSSLFCFVCQKTLKFVFCLFCALCP